MSIYGTKCKYAIICGWNKEKVRVTYEYMVYKYKCVMNWDECKGCVWYELWTTWKIYIVKNENGTLNNKLIMVTDMTKNMNNGCYDNVLCMLLYKWWLEKQW